MTRASLLTLAVLLALPGTSALAQAPVPATTDPVLVGVVLDDARGIRAALIRCAWPGASAHDYLLTPGESACGRATVAEVLPTAVRLAGPDGERRLVLREVDPAPEPARVAAPLSARVQSGSPIAPPRVAVAGRRTTVTVREEELRGYTANLAALASEAVATPRSGAKGTGHLGGFALSGVRPDGLLALIGILDGDVVVSLNGEPLRSVVPILSTLSSLPATRRAMVGVERAGDRFEFEVRVE